jgi:hypothetical protein
MHDPLAQAPLSIVPIEEVGSVHTPDAIFLANDAEDWALWAACPACTGYVLPLHVTDRGRWMEAAIRAQTFLARVHHRGCLGCESARRRAGDASDREPELWWDTETADWMVDAEVEDDVVSLPLDVRDYWAINEAAAAAAALTSDGPPVRVAPAVAVVDRSVPTVVHDPDEGRWLLWMPCDDCRGVVLPLRHIGRFAAPAAAGQAQRMIELVAEEGCPGCHAEEMRVGPPAGVTSEAWYDPTDDEWMLWQAMPGSPEGITLPLGVTGYDADRALLAEMAGRFLLG